MARRKTKKQVSSGHKNDIIGIIQITIGIIMVFSIFNSSSGILISIIKRIIFSLFGIGTYIVPFLLFFIGFCYIARSGTITFNKKFYGIMMFIINTLLFVHMVNMPLFYEEGNVMNGVVKIFNYAGVFHGGIISHIIDVPLYRLLGNVVCYIIFIATYIICFILVFDLTLYEVIGGLKPKAVKRKTAEAKENIQAKEISASIDRYVEELPKDTNDSKDGFISNVNKKIRIIDFMKNTDLEKQASEDMTLQKDKVIEKERVNTSDIKLATYGEKKEKDETEVKEAINKELNEKIINDSVNKVIQYEYPSSDLLNLNSKLKLNKDDKKELLSNASILEETLSSFGVEAKVIQVTKGPSVTRFELHPSSGVKVSKIVNLSDDIALGLAARGVRIEAPIPGKAAVGIEVPNKELTAVYLREVIDSDEFVNSKKNLAFSLGKDIAGNCVVADLTKMPHMLIAGATGSGKSVCINTLIISLLYKYSPEKVKLLMIDPKVVELNVYNGIPHLLIPVVTEPKKAAGALNWAVNEMTRRYKLFADNGVRNIEGYNDLFEKGRIEEKLPWIVIIVDELADLMMVCPNDIEDYIGRLAQMARAAGMHLVIATQRPSVDVITGVIKANIPSRISFAVSSQIDSRTILDSAGAEKLLGKGDMLFYPVGESKPIRIQGAFISEEEVEKVVNSIKGHEGEPDYRTEILDHISSSGTEGSDDRDELLDEAIRIVVESGQASTSLLQRKLRIGYNRAARVMEQLEVNGIISGRDGSKPRQILVDRSEYSQIDNEIAEE
jgi:S-DNA-T family DNA segregation ATPase FtsK/SpoIIIE